MTFNPENQRRTTIIRGRHQGSLDFFIPKYVEIINDICPCNIETFKTDFNLRLINSSHIHLTGKAASNHRTEIAGQLLGLWLFDDDNNVILSDKGRLYLSNNDNPELFKDICYKFQFPNGIDKPRTIRQNIEDGIKIKQFSFILKLLQLAYENDIYITKEEVFYYVLNALDTLRGTVPPSEVLEKIIERRSSGENFRVGTGSYNKQHLTEQLRLLVFANLITYNGDTLVLNQNEIDAINFISAGWNTELMFDIYTMVSNGDDMSTIYKNWSEYYCNIIPRTQSIFRTRLSALHIDSESRAENTGQPSGELSTTEIGNNGEEYVYNLERKRINRFNALMVNRVRNVSNQRGIGYDIISIRADGTEESENFIYIEVKSTIQVSEITDAWNDSITLTETEWTKLNQHPNDYYIIRVYFTRRGPYVFEINKIKEKISERSIVPRYKHVQLDFTNTVLEDRCQ